MACTFSDEFSNEFDRLVSLECERLEWLVNAPDSLEKQWILELLNNAEASNKERKALHKARGTSSFNPFIHD